MLRNTSSVLPRVSSLGLLFALLISACTKSSPTDLYPTYDPFSPLNGTNAPGVVQVGENTSSARLAGTTPTRAPISGAIIARNPPPSPHTPAPISVAIPARNPASSSTTPTPDQPHPLPTKRDFLDQNTVQAGDTLG